MQHQCLLWTEDTLHMLPQKYVAELVLVPDSVEKYHLPQPRFEIEQKTADVCHSLCYALVDGRVGHAQPLRVPVQLFRSQRAHHAAIQ
jgi:hypothetical protein